MWCVSEVAAPASSLIAGESAPMNFDGGFDVRMNAPFDRACVRGIFEPLPVLRTGCPWDSDGDRQPIDLPRGRAAHLLVHRHSGTRQVEIQRSCDDAHRGQHARAERSRDEVGWGKTLSTALVIYGRICGQLCFRWSVHGRAVEVTLIFRLNANHTAIVLHGLDPGNLGEPFRGELPGIAAELSCCQND